MRGANQAGALLPKCHLFKILISKKLLLNFLYFKDNLIVIDLLEWVRENFPSTQSLIPSAQEGRIGERSFLGSIMEQLMQQERPEDHESYWNAVNYHMIRSRV